MTVAILLARAGSKRIPNKNIRNFLGKPILGYPLEAAKASKVFDHIILSTDSDEIADIGKSYGAQVPFLRSKENASDSATTFDALRETIVGLDKQGIQPESICCIYATSVFLTAQWIQQSHNSFIDGNFDCYFPVTEYECPIQRAIEIDKNTKKMNWHRPEFSLSRSQDTKPFYHDVGMFYWFNTSEILQAQTLIVENSGCMIMDRMEVRILNTLQDWQLAELKYRLKNGK